MSWMWIKSQLLRELFAEFLGTFTLIVLGDGAVAQSVLTGNALGNYFSVNVGYAMAVTFGVYVSAGVSGGHINPAVTLTMALFRRLKWIKVPVYMAGQYLGAFCGAAVVYGVYFDLLKAKGLEIPDTAGIFATYPYKDITNATALGDQIVGTAMLLMLVMAVTDKRNTAPSPGLVPLLVGLIVLAIGVSLGTNAGYAINPARDLAPRLLTVCVGYGKEVFSYPKSHYYFWIPIVGPHIGAMLGASLYVCLIQHHWPRGSGQGEPYDIITTNTDRDRETTI